MSKFNDPNYYPASATSSSWSLFKQTFMNGKPKKKKTGTTSAKKPSTSSSSTSSSSLNHPGVRASLPNPHNAPRYSDDSSSNGGNESPVNPVLDNSNSQSTPNLPFQRNHSMTDFAMENQEKYEGYEDSEPVFATEEETPLSSSSNSSSSALTTGELSQSSLTSYQQRPLPPIPSDTSLSNLDESNSTPATPGLDALVDTIVEETQEDDTEAEQPFQDVTDMTQIKPSMLYHYVLRKFVKNIDGYDDHTCSDQFDEFITQYYELCTKLKEEGNEEMKEFFSWTDKDVRKLRDKEKPRTFLLHQCAKYNRSSLIFLLVSKYKCNIMAPDEAESTPMHYACNHRGYEAISILCQLKSKINIRDKFGKSPLQLLFNKAFIDEEIGDLQSAQEGFKSSRVMCGQFEGDYNFKTTDGSTILHMACEAGRLNAVKFLVSESAEVNSSGGMASSQTGNKVLINSKDNFGRTPIMRAAASGHINIVEYILTNTNPAVVFGPASRDDKKQNILHHAAVMGTDPLINRLAFLNPTQCASLMKEQDSTGNTPLHLAVQNANIKTVNLLLTLLSKDSMNVQNDKGETPLHSACRLKEKNVAERLCGFLYQSGASEKVKDKSGQTPKQLATENDLTVSFVKRKK